MTSRASDLNRAALGSPGAALAPLDSDARADYRQDRIGLFARLFLALHGIGDIQIGMQPRHGCCSPSKP
jgi:hypothetical protein